MKSFQIFSPSFIGIDVGPCAIKLVELRKRRRGDFIVEQAECVELSQPILVEGKINNWDVLSSTVARWVQQLNLYQKSAVISLPVDLVHMQSMQALSNMTDDILEAEIEAQISRDFPSLQNELQIDYQKGIALNGYVDVNFVMTRQDYLQRYIECIEATGLKVKIVDIDIYALERVSGRLLPDKDIKDEHCIILFAWSDCVIFLLCDARNIIKHHYWSINESMDFYLQLKSRLKIFCTHLTNIIIKKIYFYMDQLYRNTILNCMMHDPLYEHKYVDIQEINLLRQFKFKEHLSIDNLSHFLIALGLAMRESPKW